MTNGGFAFTEKYKVALNINDENIEKQKPAERELMYEDVPPPIEELLNERVG